MLIIHTHTHTHTHTHIYIYIYIYIYIFVSDYDRSMIRKVWNLTCMDRYSDSLAKARKKARERANSDNIEYLNGFGPRGIRIEMWDALIDIWKTKEWKKKSITGKNKRAAKPEAMLHIGGSISFGQHLKKMVFIFLFILVISITL